MKGGDDDPTVAFAASLREAADAVDALGKWQDERGWLEKLNHVLTPVYWAANKIGGRLPWWVGGRNYNLVDVSRIEQVQQNQQLLSPTQNQQQINPSLRYTPPVLTAQEIIDQVAVLYDVPRNRREDLKHVIEDFAARAQETTTPTTAAPRLEHAATETITSKERPRPDWIEAHKRGVTVPEFIKDAFAVELRDGSMHKGLFSRYENLRRDFYSYKRSNELSDWLKAIPTQEDWNTRRLAELGRPPRPAPRPPRPRTDETRLYDVASKRRARAGHDM